MTIDGISNYDQAAQLAQISMLSAVQSVDPTQAGSAASQSGIQPSSDKANFSQTGQMMSQLSKLQTSDPAQFKAVTQGIAQELSAQAQNSQNPLQSQVLTSLSNKFAQASQTGSMSALEQHHGGGGHGGKAQGADGKGGDMSAVFSTISQDLAGLASNAGSSIFSLDGASSASNAGVSANPDPAQMMRDLEKLRETDPAKFKAVTQKISDDLATQAKNSTDPAQAKMLTDMSTKFAQASQTGQMPAMKSHKHGHGHGSGKSGGDASSLTDALDNAISNELAALSNSSPGANAFSSLGSGLGSGTTNAYLDSFLKSQALNSTLDFSSLGAAVSL